MNQVFDMDSTADMGDKEFHFHTAVFGLPAHVQEALATLQDFVDMAETYVNNQIPDHDGYWSDVQDAVMRRVSCADEDLTSLSDSLGAMAWYVAKAGEAIFDTYGA